MNAVHSSSGSPSGIPWRRKPMDSAFMSSIKTLTWLASNSDKRTKALRTAS
ncbi:hypothetical protein D3C75_1166980 [compost metagenome]